MNVLTELITDIFQVIGIILAMLVTFGIPLIIVGAAVKYLFFS